MGSSCTKIGGLLQNVLIHWNASHPSDKRRYHGNQKQQQHDGEEQESWTERLLRWTMEELSVFATDAERRDLVSIGASVGFAASFGAPIGGLLFILDDISCYFERHLLLRMLIGNAIGTFCLALKHRNLSNYGIINMGDYETTDDNIFVTRLLETPLYVLMGVGGGLLGGFFCAGYLWLRRNITSRFPPARGRAKFQLLEVAVVSILTSAVMFYLPTVSWACKPINEVAALDIANYESKRFFCQHGEINEMATMMFGSRIKAIKEILTDPSSYQQRTLLAVGGVFYVLTIITFGTAIPAGLFTPTILIGAALGGAAGNFLNQYIDKKIAPSTFALLGVASMLAGIQRSTVSVAIILVEGTGQIKVLLPVIIVVVTSRYVAQSLHTLGVFEAAMEYKNLPYLEHEKIPRYFDAVAVKEIMSESPLVCLEAHEKVHTLVEFLDEYGHHCFPVVERGSRQFIGLVKRAQIAALLECGVFSKHQSARSEDHPAAGSCGFHVDCKDAAPIMYWAYCINDDRYAHVMALPEEEPSQFYAPETEFNQEERASSPRNRSTRLLLMKKQKEISKSMHMSLMHMEASSSISWSLGDVPQDFCTVTRNDNGSIVISSMSPQYLQVKCVILILYVSKLTITFTTHY
jgi:H+/Cl- antiporter ClcA